MRNEWSGDSRPSEQRPLKPGPPAEMRPRARDFGGPFVGPPLAASLALAGALCFGVGAFLAWTAFPALTAASRGGAGTAAASLRSANDTAVSCPPMAGNSDLSYHGWMLQPGFFRAVVVAVAFPMAVDTLSYYCQGAGTIGAVVGVFKGSTLLSFSGGMQMLPCPVGGWVDMRIRPQLTLRPGDEYVLVHMHISGLWFTSAGVGNLFVKSPGSFLSGAAKGYVMPTTLPYVSPIYTGTLPLVLKSCALRDKYHQAAVPVELVEGRPRCGFVMMAYQPHPTEFSSLWGVLPIARALLKTSAYPLVLLTNSTHFPDGTPLAHKLRRLNVQILPIYKVDIPGSSASTLRIHSWIYAFWKLQIWTLTQFDKLIWLDSDAVLVRSIDWLMDRPGMWAQRDDWYCEGNKSAICSGLLVVYPNLEDFYGMLQFASTLTQLEHGDQELIGRYFAEVRQEPIGVVSDVEAGFGQCLGKAPSPFWNWDRTAVKGTWNLPAMVHKSGGWGSNVNLPYLNACFQHDMSLQLYRIGDTVINACHFHPLGNYWRDLFCQAVELLGGLSVDSVKSFCDDACWYRGVSSSVDSLALCTKNATVSQADLDAHVLGHPLPVPASLAAVRPLDPRSR